MAIGLQGRGEAWGRGHEYGVGDGLQPLNAVDAEDAEVRRASVGCVERSDTHHAFVAMGIGLGGLNPSYVIGPRC